MNNKLYIVVDCSGSMFEMAKLSISMNLLSTVREYKHSFNEITLFFWSDDIKEINFIETNDFMSYSALGKLNFNKLEEKLMLLSQKEEEVKTLLLSDGNFNDFEFEKFSNNIKKLSNIYISPIQIGSDSSINKLKSISFYEHVYFAEDILTAIKSLEYISIENPLNPTFIESITRSGEEESMEEW